MSLSKQTVSNQLCSLHCTIQCCVAPLARMHPALAQFKRIPGHCWSVRRAWETLDIGKTAGCFNTHYCNGGKYFPQTDLFTAISKPLGVNRNALVTFPRYDAATKRHIFRNSIPTRQSKMAATKPVINIFSFINNTKQCSKGSATPRNEISPHCINEC